MGRRGALLCGLVLACSSTASPEADDSAGLLDRGGAQDVFAVDQGVRADGGRDEAIAPPDVAMSDQDASPYDVSATDIWTAEETSSELIGETWQDDNWGIDTAVDIGPQDSDDDGILDADDNCPAMPNPDQSNLDGDKQGDVCDPDMDGDFVVNGEDNCPEVSNAGQGDMDGDGAGDPCDADTDGDGLANVDDNCPTEDNADQLDFDLDGLGDPCDPDDDGDGVPDVADEAPLDDKWPGLAVDGAIYAHTSSALYKFDPTAQTVETVGTFLFPNGGQQMTDIAIDYEGRLFGVSFTNLYRCSAKTAECIHLGSLPASFNGMTIVPVGTLEPGVESMIGIGNSGSWNRITVVGNQATITQLGSYGAGYSSAGDAYSIEGIGTFAAVNKSGQGSTWLVRVDPAVGTVVEEVGAMTGYSQIFGLASDGETAYAFDAGGTILALDPLTGISTVALPAGQGKSWWGAGVTTRYFNKD